MSAVEGLSPAFPLPTLGPLTVARGATAAPRASAALVGRQQWERRFRRTLRVSDSLVVIVSCLLASSISLLTSHPDVLANDPWVLARVPACTALIWLLTMALFSTRDTAILGVGSAEYTRVAHATGLAFGVLAIVFVVFEWDGVRTQLWFALPVGMIGLISSRWLLRRWLIAQRARHGRYSSRTVVVGTNDDVAYTIRILGSSGVLGYRVVGAVVTDAEEDRVTVAGASYPAFPGQEAIGRAIASLTADTILIASQPSGDPTYIKRLAWQLEGSAAELVLSSRIADVAGPRMSLRPVEGLPLLHVRIPAFAGGAYAIKRALDILTASAALVCFAPLAVLISLAIKVDDRGPAFFLQSRIGRDGREFKMVKFRSMRVTAESELAALRPESEGAGPLFKMKADPRVTRIGRVLRKYSLDEVPQFWNVLKGDMSVVGPRPPLPEEVTMYDGAVSRRLYIKPGITGPWQVGGRSDLSWDESVRLDLRYVENWSVMSDLVLMWRTLKVMVRPDGAY